MPTSQGFLRCLHWHIHFCNLICLEIASQGSLLIYWPPIRLVKSLIYRRHKTRFNSPWTTGSWFVGGRPFDSFHANLADGNYFDELIDQTVCILSPYNMHWDFCRSFCIESPGQNNRSTLRNSLIKLHPRKGSNSDKNNNKCH